MNLKQKLANIKTEEDVKDAYIEVLNLPDYNKTLVDIRTKDVWFEAKATPTPPLLMFTQLLFYVRGARKKSEQIPPFLVVFDTEKAAILETSKVLALFDDTEIIWPKSGSLVDKALAALVAPYIDTHFTVYTVESDEKEFIEAVNSAIKSGKIIRTPITPDNLRQVFDKWVEMIGRELDGVIEIDYALLFFADIMHDGERTAMNNLPARLLYDGGRPVFLLNGKSYDLVSERGYRNFWAIYDRPPEQKHRHYLLERRDSLLPLDERSFKGAFYTPLHIVDKAYGQLTLALGENWQERYIIWDMCCGVGNLEVKHSNYRNVYMSTLDQADIDVMKASHTCVGATIFQYDYLNDDITDFGEIDYTFSNKVPPALRQALADANAGKEGAKKILVLINPPYAEATSGGNTVADAVSSSKAGVANTRFAQTAMKSYGKANNELFTQFVARVYQEVPAATLAMFSTLKYINAQALDEFRYQWKARYLGGFVTHSKAFDGLIGEFPIGFLIWDTSIEDTIFKINTTVIDKNANYIGEKQFVNVKNNALLTKWVSRNSSNSIEVVPLKNAISPATSAKDLRGIHWSNDAIAWLNCAGNDFQNAAGKTMLFSSGYSSARGFFVTAENLWQAAIVFSVRRLIKPTWLNDRDQFLQPTQPLQDVFKSDCLIWMLFNGSNLTASANDLRWDNRNWSIVNHFIPFSERDLGVNSRFESDFMVRYIADMSFSAEAQALLDEGKKLWQKYHATQFGRSIRDEFKLNRPDVGWYQVRKALEANTQNELVDFTAFKAAYSALGDKLRPQVYELGFLPE